MSLMNRLGNAKNPYQTEAKRVLCLCSAGLLRSPTCANVLHVEYGYNTRAAGVSQEYALIEVSDVLLHWADEVVCVEQSVADLLQPIINDMGIDVEVNIKVLNIPDQYEWGSDKIKEALLKQYEEASDGA